MQKLIKNPIFMFMLGVVISIGITSVFAYSLLAPNVGYTPKDEEWDVSDVKEALDDLQERAIIEVPRYIKSILISHNKKYTLGLKDIISDADIYDTVINGFDTFDYETLNALISSPNIKNNSDYTRKIKGIIERDYTVVTTPVQTNNDRIFGTAQYDGSGTWNLWKAFDGTSSDYAYRGNGSFYLGFRFDNPVYVFEFSLIQRSSVEGVDNVSLYYSDDNSNYTLASDTYTTQRVGGTEQKFLANKSVGKHRYWKIQGTGYGTNGGMVELEFYGME
ncbi:MAG: hypothetical protein IJ572_00835 [Bacilli bacterium]|nr:hypothetical protein [Bacilli bacterium]